jgi:hypothetical protein
MLQNGEGGDFVVEVRQKDGQQNKVLLKTGEGHPYLFLQFPLFH